MAEQRSRDEIRAARRDRVARSREQDQGPQVQQSQEGPDTTATLAPLADANPEQWLDLDGNTDLMVSLPNLGVDRIKLTVDNIDAQVQVQVKVLDLLDVKVGAVATIDKIDLEIDNVRVQAMVKVQLEKVVTIVDRVMTTLENQPDLLRDLAGKSGDSGDAEKPTVDRDSEQEDPDS